MFRNLILVLTLAFFTLGISGCGFFSSEGLETRANDAVKAADALDEFSDKLEGWITQYDAGMIEESQLADFIAGAIPDNWVSKFEQARELLGSVRAAAYVLVNDLPVVAADLRAEAMEWREQAAKNESTWNNALVLGMSLTELLAGGTITTLVGSIVALFRSNRKKDGAIEELVDSNEVLKVESPETWDTKVKPVYARNMSTGTKKIVAKSRKKMGVLKNAA
jgi:hypothetical protein